MEELKIRFDLEISKREGKISSLKEQNEKLQNLINKYTLTQNNLKIEKNEIQNNLFKELKKNEQLNDKIKQINLLLKLKNDQININNKYSIELIRIVNNLKEKVDKDKNQKKQNKIVNNLNKEIQNLKKQLQINKSFVIDLEAKNKVLENNYKNLSNNYNELKTLQEKEKEHLTKTQFKLKFLEKENFFTTNLEEINSDNYLISESVLPQILPNSKNTKDYYQSIINYSQNDIYNTQHDINEINQLMNNIINDINGNKGF